jgi:hypothetical protein
MTKPARKPIPLNIEALVLVRSRRRCALCFHLEGDLAEKHGQLAHLDDNPANGAEENLAFLCFVHHSLFDSKTSQHKNYTIAEVKAARDELYAAIRDNRHIAHRPTAISRRLTDRKALDDLIQLMTETGTMRLLHDADFGGWSFPWHEVEGLDQFVRESQGPEREFIDLELEALRRDLVGASEAFLSAFTRNTHRVPWTPRYRAVPRAWEDEEPERFAEAVDALHGAAARVYTIYEALVRLGRTRLAP